MDDSNPYRPPSPVPPTDTPAERLVFDGTISESDYVSMLPDNRLAIWTFRILVWFTTLLGILMLGTIVVAMIRDGDFEMLFPGIALCGVLAVINFVAFWFVSPVKRGRKQLKRFPDVIGQTQGKFSTSGLDLNDGNCVHWFGPRTLNNAAVLANGIRVPLDINPYRYLAFSKRLFDGYDKEMALRLKRHWTSQFVDDMQTDWTKDPFAPDTGPHWEPTEGESSNLIRFQGPMTLQLSTKTAAQRKQAVTETAATVIGVLGATAVWLTFGSFWGFIGLLYVAAATWSSYKNWRFYYSGQHEHSWNQAGWVDSESFAFRSDDNGFWVNKLAFTEVSIEPQLITLVLTPQSPVYLPKDQVADEANWKKLSLWAQSLKRKLELEPQVQG